MTVTASLERTARRTPFAQAQRPMNTAAPRTMTCPFEPETGAIVSVREWRGDEDLEHFNDLIRLSARPENFHIQARTARFGQFDITYMVHGPLRLEAAGDNWGHAVNTLRLLVVLDGEVILRHGDMSHGEMSTLRRRDGALLLGWEEIAYTANAPARVVIVDVPSDHDVLGGLPETAPFVAGGTESALLSALAAFALDLLRQDVESLTPSVRAQITDSLESLISGTVSTLAVPSGGDWNRRSQRMHVVRYIATHSADPELGPSTLATHLGMSKRSLQRLFEGEKYSVSQLIQAKRVDQVLLRLRDPRYAATSLDEMAVLTGFGSALALRRAVQTATGRTPSALRAEAVAGN
ncbi:MAG: AraC family transcriptional regulator [Cellulomonadaceae bacterium]|jgi:AraC-like DNA-binding protein|nr:AraC family transcriptional regulator [Cellulomonadaceae bacterium]